MTAKLNFKKEPLPPKRTAPHPLREVYCSDTPQLERQGLSGALRCKILYQAEGNRYYIILRMNHTLLKCAYELIHKFV
jgi:hypothetical protein